MINSLVFQVVITIILVGYTSYLFYMRAKNERALRRYKPGSWEYELYSKLYSKEALMAFALLSLSSAIDLVIGFYRHSTDNPSMLVFMPALVIQITASVIALYKLYLLFWKKPEKR